MGEGWKILGMIEDLGTLHRLCLCLTFCVSAFSACASLCTYTFAPLAPLALQCLNPLAEHVSFMRTFEV